MESVINIVPKRHSRTGASGYHRWKADACPGSVRLIRESAPPELAVEDEVRDDGIEAHAMGEELLKTQDKVARSVLLATWGNNGVPYKMINDVFGYVEYVERLATLPDAQMWVEQEFNLDWLWAEPILDAKGKETDEYESVLFGTSDSIIYAPSSKFLDLEENKLYEGPILHVIDLKYGPKRVEAFENPQGLYYALGAYAKLRAEGKQVKRVVIHIYQPRARDGRSKALTWSCDEVYLENFAIQLQNDVTNALEDDAQLNPDTSWCRLCPARTVCPELVKPGYNAAVLQLINQGKDPAKELPTLEVAMTDRAAQFKIATLAEVWADGLKSRTRVEMNQGGKYDGLKLVAGRNSRYLINGHLIQEQFPAARFPDLYEKPELKSAAQCLEILEKAGVDVKKFASDYVRSKPGEPLVALANDKRAAFDPAAKAAEEWADELVTPVVVAPPKPPVSMVPPPPPVVQEVSIFAVPNGHAQPVPPPPPPAYVAQSIFNK